MDEECVPKDAGRTTEKQVDLKQSGGATSGRDAVKYSKHLPQVLMNVLPPSSGLKSEQQTCSKMEAVATLQYVSSECLKKILLASCFIPEDGGSALVSSPLATRSRAQGNKSIRSVR